MQNLEAFALGFSLSEGILRDTSQLFDVNIESAPLGITVEMDGDAITDGVSDGDKPLVGVTASGASTAHEGTK